MFHPVGQPLERGWVGRIDGEHVVQLAAQTLESFFTGGGSAREHAVYPLGGVRLLAPVLHPPAIRVFERQGSFAFANPAAVAAPGEVPARGPVGRLSVLPRLAAVIGADESVAGFTGVADWRDPAREPPKDRDFALGLGPAVVTAGDLAPDGLGLVARVDGAEALRERFEGFDWGSARDLAAEGTRLRPGDLLVGPAPDSVEVPRGSTVELELDGIGVLGQTLLRD